MKIMNDLIYNAKYNNVIHRDYCLMKFMNIEELNPCNLDLENEYTSVYNRDGSKKEIYVLVEYYD